MGMTLKDYYQGRLLMGMRAARRRLMRGGTKKVENMFFFVVNNNNKKKRKKKKKVQVIKQKRFKIKFKQIDGNINNVGLFEGWYNGIDSELFNCDSMLS
jgi:hypothetical protein